MKARKYLTLFNGGIRLPYSIDFANGQGAFAGETWSIVGNYFVNTPTLGSELLSNGNMETGDPPTGWPNFAGATVSSEAEERTGGSGSASLKVARNGSDFPSVKQSVTVSVGDWILLNGWIKNVDVTVANIEIRNSSHVVISGVSQSGTSWAEHLVVGRATSTTTGIFTALYSPGADGTYALFDDLSAKKITKADTFAKLAKPFTNALVVRAGWNIVGDVAQSGVFGWWDGADALQNCLIAYHDGKKVWLDKYVGSTLTNLVNSTEAHVPGANVEIRRIQDTNDFQLYYGGSQVGADQTVSDAAIISNGYFGLFSVGTENQASSFDLSLSPL